MSERRPGSPARAEASSRRGMTLVEVLIAFQLVIAVVALAAGALSLLWRGTRQSGAGDPLDLAVALERVEREVRGAARVVLPPLRSHGLEARRSDSAALYVVDAAGSGTLLHVAGRTLHRTRIAPGGAETTEVLARGVERVTFRALGGALPRVQIALSAGEAVLVGQAPVLAREPAAAGGMGHGFR